MKTYEHKHSAILRHLCLLVVMCLLVATVPAVRAEQVSNEEQIYNCLTQNMGLNAAVASGILANIQRESSFDPVAECIDTNDLISFGLCQWNGPRFTALKNYCEEKELDYRSIDGQMRYLQYELETSERYAFSKVKDLPETADGAYMAAYNWARYFERCAHYNSSGADMYEVRGNLAIRTYWPRYGNGGVCPSHPFTDIPAPHNWAHDGIDFVVSCELFTGTSETEFTPAGEMTRAMLVTVLWRYEGKPEPDSQNKFTDVPSGRWYTNAVVWAAENEIVTGVEETEFDPNGNVTRQQIATILYRDAERRLCDMSGSADLGQFADAKDVSRYALDAMQWAVANELIDGVSQEEGASLLQPKGNATRAQVATILYRYVKNMIGF